MNTVSKTKKVKLKVPEELNIYPQYIPSNSDTIEDELELADDVEVEFYIKLNKKVSTRFGFCCNQLPHCCGVYELGSFVCFKQLKPEHINKMLNISLQSLTKPNNRCKTVIINTNGKDDCIPLEAALKVNENFTMVKEFINTGSGSKIKMWVSNN